MTPVARGGRKALPYVLIVLGMLACWTILAIGGTVDPTLLPAPLDTFDALWHLVGDAGSLLATAGATARSVAVAVAIAAPCGVLLGLIVGGGTLVFRALEPLLAHLNTVPIVLLYPLLLGALGSGPAAKIILGALTAALAIAISVAWAVRGVDQELVTAARSMGANRTAVAWTVVLPAVLPGLFAGLRTGTGLAVVTVVAGEFISSTTGLGYELAQTSETFQTPELFAWLIVTALFAAAVIGAVNTVAAVLNRKVVR